MRKVIMSNKFSCEVALWIDAPGFSGTVQPLEAYSPSVKNKRYVICGLIL